MKQAVIIPALFLEIEDIDKIINKAFERHDSGLSIVDFSEFDENKYEFISTILDDKEYEEEIEDDPERDDRVDIVLPSNYGYLNFKVELISDNDEEDHFASIIKGPKAVITFSEFKHDPDFTKKIAEHLVNYTNGYLLLNKENTKSFSIHRSASNLDQKYNHDIFKNMLLNDLNQQMSYLPENTKNKMLIEFEKIIDKENKGKVKEYNIV